MREQVGTDRCPSLGDLVLAADGGLSPSHKAETMAHLRECAACRESLAEANAFVEASGEFEELAELADGENAPHASSALKASNGVTGWNGVNGLNARAAMRVSYDEKIGAKYDSVAKGEARVREFTRRLHKQKQDVIHRPAPAPAWVRQWLPAAAVITLLIAGLSLPRMQTVVRAEELLKLASTHESSLRADRVQRMRFSLTPGIAAFAPPAPGGSRAETPRVTPFRAVRDVVGGSVRDAWIDGGVTSGEFARLAEMLSRHGFEWRQPMSLAGVRAWRASPGEKHDEVFVSADLLVLRTTASEGPLREVELTVRRHDYHVVKLALAFEGMGRLEIAEIEESVPSLRAALPAAPVTSTAAAPVATAIPAPMTRDLAADAALSPVTTVVGRAPMPQAGLSRWLDRTFAATPARKTFVPELQRLVIGVRQQLSALDTLARRYPEAEVEQQWSDADREALRHRVEESYRRVARDLNDLEARIGILFGSPNRALPVTETPADWRQRAAIALAHAEAMDAQVRHLLTLDDVPSNDARGRNASTGAPGAAGAAGAAGAGSGALVPSTFAALWDVVHAPAGGPASR